MKIRRVSRYRKLLLAMSLPLLAAGAVCMVVFLSMLLANDASSALFVVSWALGVPGLLLGWGARRLRKTEDRYRRYLLIAGRAAYIPVQNFVTVTGLSRETVKRDLQDMADRGYFGPRAFVDASRWVLVADPAAPRPAMPEQRARPQAQPEPEKPSEDAYGELLGSLHAINGRILNEAMHERILRIESISRAIFRAVEDKPEKKPQINMFMNYYLPTTVKLLESYAGFERNAVTGENIEKSKACIESITLTLADAFEKQFDSLFASDAIDISTEIEVMQNMLRRDGFIDGGLRMQMPGG